MRRRGGADAATGTEPGGPGGSAGDAGFAMPLSIVAAVAVSSPVLLASLQGRLEARTGIAAFVVALAGVWMLGAMGSRAVAALDRSVTRRRLGTTPGGPGRGDGGPVG